MIDSTIYPADTVDTVGENMIDSTIYPADTVDTVGENMIDSTIYPAAALDTVGENMSDCKVYPADTVDIYGNVWQTVGENIRNGIFGKLKVGKIKINRKNITSSDFVISNIRDSDFVIDKKAILVFVDKVYESSVSIRIVYFKKNCSINFSHTLDDTVTDLTVLYKE